MFKKNYFFIFLFIFFNNYNLLANNKEAVVDSIYYDWIVYRSLDKEEEKKCYMATFAKEKSGNYKKNRQPYIMIAIFKSKNTEEISIDCGYKFKIKSNIFLGLDNKQFRLMTEEDKAWASNSEEDKMIIEELLNAEVIKVKGETISGEYTIDTYSNKGISRAYNKIQELCK